MEINQMKIAEELMEGLQCYEINEGKAQSTLELRLGNLVMSSELNDFDYNNVGDKQCKQPKLPKGKLVIPFKYNGHDIMIHVDSGAETNFIDRRLVPEALIRKCTPYSVKGAHSEVNDECARIKFTINTVTVEHTFAVIKNYQYDMVLGFPFCSDYEHLISIKDRTLAGIGKDGTALVQKAEFERLMAQNKNTVGMCYIRFEEIEGVDALTLKLASLEIGSTDKEIVGLVKEFEDIFTDDLTSTVATRPGKDYNIEVKPYEYPPLAPQYPLGKPEYEELSRQVSAMLQAGIVEPSKEMRFNAPILFVKKKDGSYRMCTDYRLLNKVTVDSYFEMPLVSDLTRRCSGYKYYSSLDMTASFHQIKLDPKCRGYTAFTAFSRKYQYALLPFGLKQAPAVLQHRIAELLQGLDGVVNYIDDILVYSNTKEEHMRILHDAFERFRQENYKLKPSKCTFLTNEVKFLGYTVSERGTTIPESQVDVIKGLKLPEKPKEMHSILGFFNYFRQFVRNYSKLVVPLYDWLSKKRKRDEVVIHAFDEVKKALCNAQLLKNVKDEFDAQGKVVQKQFIIESDASHHSLGAILFQLLDNAQTKYGPIEMYSRKFKPNELNYPVRQKELLGIVVGLKKFRHHLMGHKVIADSDHESLSKLLSTNRRPESERITRWLETIADFDVIIRYKRGDENVLADVLSRYTTINQVDLAEMSLSFPSNLERLKKSYAGSEYDKIYKCLIGPSDEIPPDMKKPLESFRVNDKKLLEFKPQYSSNYKIVLTEAIAREMVVKAHEFGHFGQDKTYHRIQPTYYVKNLMDKIRNVIDICDVCQRKKATYEDTNGYLLPSLVPKDRFSTIHLDFVTGLPESHGFDTVLVCVCALTKYAVFIPTRKNVKVDFTAKLLIEEVFSVFGLPDIVKSDKDIQFMNGVFKYIIEYFGLDWRTTSTNHPQTNGQVEAINKTLVSTLKTYCQSDHYRWYEHLKVAQFAINTSYSKAIGMSPYEAMFAKKPRVPLALVDENGKHVGAEHTSVKGEELTLRMEMVQQQIRETMEWNQLQMGIRANVGKKPPVFEVGEEVLVLLEAYYTRRRFWKLLDTYYGPFKLVAFPADNPNAAEIDLPSVNKKDRVINIRHLRKYKVREGRGAIYKAVPKYHLERQFFNRANEVKSVLGYDAELQEYLCTFMGSQAGHCVGVPKVWFNAYVEESLQKSLLDNMVNLYGDRVKADGLIAEPEEDNESSAPR